MTNEQYPNPWSRDAQAPHPQAEQAGGTDPSQARPGSPFPTWNSASGAFGQPGAAPRPAPMAGEPFTPAAPSATKPKGRSRIAGLLALAVLAGGAGGGAGFAAARLTQGQGATASTTTTSSTQSGPSTTVVQADPSNPDWTAVAKAASKSVVAIQVTSPNGQSQGSGVVIDAKGHIVTNNHVVAGASQGSLRVTLGTVSYEATVVGTDPSTDLAVIKMADPPSDLSVMSYGDSAAMNVGDPVMAIGNPLGLADTVTTGIVSALNRPVTTTAASEDDQNQRPGFGQQMAQTTSETVVTAAIQTNAAINPGNSGGALVDSAGKLVGITSSIATLSGGQSQSGNIGIGFAIGADQVKYVADQLISTGKAQHPQLGLSATDVTTTGQQGAVVAQVGSGSPAEKAGLKVNDLITAVNGLPVTGSESLVALVRAAQVGQPMKLTVVRGGAEETISVTPIAAKA